MAKIYPQTLFSRIRGAGAYRERDVIEILETGFDDSYDVFHNLDWSAMKAGRQSYGELDVVMVSPQGHIVLLEIKAGEVELINGNLYKSYRTPDGYQKKSVADQTHRQFESMKTMLLNQGFDKVRISHFLVLPDYHVQNAVISYPRERIIDASQFQDLSNNIRQGFQVFESALEHREKLISFLSNQLEVKHDFQNHLLQLQNAQYELASGLAYWVPKISHPQQIYVVNATAGSGKTQLAIQLLQKQKQQKKVYVCFNRPLADHMQKIVGVHTRVQTFHEHMIDFVRSQIPQLDMKRKDLFLFAEQYYLANADEQMADLDLLVVDESQDFKDSWIECLYGKLKPDGKLYVLRDAEQNIYRKDAFDLKNAVTIESTDNYRSPQKLVKFINQLRLTEQPVRAMSLYEGFDPNIEVYEDNNSNALSMVEKAVRSFIKDGFLPHQIAVISFKGKENSGILALDEIAKLKTKRPLYEYDEAGNALWSQGDLLLDNVYRFKGQSAPAIVFCDIDFSEMNENVIRKLFVGITRAQVKISMIWSRRALALLLERIETLERAQ